MAALPLVLWGRLEGFPTLFLVTLVGWAWTWILSGFVHQDMAPAWLAGAMSCLLGVKLVSALALLARSLWQGYVSWRFPVVLLLGWGAVVAVLWELFPVFQTDGIEGFLALALLVPLARLAACPLTMAANRHR